MTAYYNEFDPFAAAWLRNLIAAGHIAPGDVDERSIEDVSPDDLRPYTQCHFFAGIGVWSHALRGAGWRDDEPIWTGSCPCQPFSAAGKGGGFDDERHLWPAFFHLIQQCDPAIVIGEQVASKDGLTWLDLVRADVEGTGRAFAAADLCAAGVGAPHIRQRTFWLADSNSDGRASRERVRSFRAEHDAEYGDGVDGLADGERQDTVGSLSSGTQSHLTGGGDVNRLDDDDDDARPQGHTGDDGAAGGRQEPGRPIAASSVSDGVDDTASTRHVGAIRDAERHSRHEARLRMPGVGRETSRPAPTNGFWSDADWLYCRDGKWRPVEPGTFPLVNGATNRVGRLRGYGNAIVAPVAQTFIEAVIEARCSAALLT